MMPAHMFWLLNFIVFVDSYSEKIYYLSDEIKNWSDAKSYCEEHHKDLAIIYNQGDLKKALAVVESLPDEVWIGFHKDPLWWWSNGEDCLYFNWAPGFDGTSTHDCAFSVSGNWQTINCTGYCTYMCQKVTNTSGETRKTYVHKSEIIQWEAALKSCSNDNSELASITSKQDQEEFDKLAPEGSHVWIGLKRVNTVWKQSSGEPFPNWAASYSFPIKICTALSRDRKMISDYCLNRKRFLCYTVTPTTSFSMTTTVRQPTNSSSTISLSNMPSFNLTYTSDTKTWIEALHYCQNHHKTLVHIINCTVQDYVTQMLQNESYPNGVWIGLERNILFACAPWLWTGGPYVNYSNWNSSFPVDPTCQYCGKLVGNGTKWLDACCDERLPFICQD